MLPAASDLQFVQKFTQFVKDPTLGGKYTELKEIHENKTEFSYLRIVASLVLTALAAVAYTQRYTRAALGFAVVGAAALLLSRVTSRGLTDAFKQQSSGIEEATQGILERLHFYTKAKQETGISLLQRTNFGKHTKPNASAKAALEEFVLIYNKAKESLPLDSVLDGFGITANMYDEDNNASVYRQIFPLAINLLENKLTLPDTTPALLKEKIDRIQQAANILVHGYDKQQNEVEAKDYLFIELDADYKAIVRTWIDFD